MTAGCAYGSANEATWLSDHQFVTMFSANQGRSDSVRLVSKGIVGAEQLTFGEDGERPSTLDDAWEHHAANPAHERAGRQRGQGS